eukprot:scaffold561_cov18-Tisochrysis_lutea.AAC.1
MHAAHPSPPLSTWCVQVWSVAATWPLIYPLVKYRNIATRVAVTIAMLAVIRSGLYIALPGVDLAAVPAALPAREGWCGSFVVDLSVSVRSGVAVRWCLPRSLKAACPPVPINGVNSMLLAVEKGAAAGCDLPALELTSSHDVTR